MMRHDGEDAYDWDGMRRRSEIEEVSEEDDAAEESSPFFRLPSLGLPRICNSLRAPLLSVPPPAR